MEIKIDQITVHKIGNKLNGGNLHFSKGLLSINENMHSILSQYFFSTLNENILYNLYHESDLFLNEIYTYTSRIFEDNSTFYEESKNIAKHLFQKSEHPQIKEGDLYIAHLKSCIIEGTEVDAIGIFKSENRDTLIKIDGNNGIFSISLNRGSNIKKLDKGCIIYNISKENGYIVSLIDNTSKNGIEAQYWKDDFLHSRPRKDDYLYTNAALNFCKSFVKDFLKESTDISNIEKAELLNKTVSYFKDNDEFTLKEYANKVFLGEATKDAFLNYKKQYEEETETRVIDKFNISNDAVKKQIKSIKNIIKLDDNFRILVEGNNVLMKKGYDEEKKMFFYTLYFNNKE